MNDARIFFVRESGCISWTMSSWLRPAPVSSASHVVPHGRTEISRNRHDNAARRGLRYSLMVQTYCYCISLQLQKLAFLRKVLDGVGTSRCPDSPYETARAPSCPNDKVEPALLFAAVHDAPLAETRTSLVWKKPLCARQALEATSSQLHRRCHQQDLISMPGTNPFAYIENGSKILLRCRKNHRRGTFLDH